MEKTYDEIVNLVAEYVWLESDMDDYDKGEFHGAAFVVSRMFNKYTRLVKRDIRKAYEEKFVNKDIDKEHEGKTA